MLAGVQSVQITRDKFAKFVMDVSVDLMDSKLPKRSGFFSFFFLISTCELFPINTVHIKNPSAFSN